MTMFIRFILIVLLTAAVIASGCATRIEITAPPPSTGPLAGGKVLGVGSISSDSLLTEKALEDAFRNEPGLTSSRDKADILLSGRAAFHLNDQKGEDLVEVKSKTSHSRTIAEKDPFVGKTFTRQQPVVEIRAESKPYIFRSAELQLTYTLTDRSGKELQPPNTISVSSNIKYGGVNEDSPYGPELGALPPERATAEDLAAKLADKLTKSLVPTAEKYIAYLDPGKGAWGDENVRRGIALAQAGDWDNAMTAWQSVLSQIPHHPAANYNLGIAYERLGGKANLEKASDYFANAAREGNNPLYREALTRVVIELNQLQQP